MEYIVSSCEKCGGWCCKALVTAGASDSIWLNLDPDLVIQQNPWIPREVRIPTFQWVSCSRLGEKGLCSQYNNRLVACRDYPNLDKLLMEYLSEWAWFYVPWCSYRSAILEVLGIEYQFIETGEQCRLLYLHEILNDPSIATDFHGTDSLLDQAKNEQSPTSTSGTD